MNRKASNTNELLAYWLCPMNIILFHLIIDEVNADSFC